MGSGIALPRRRARAVVQRDAQIEAVRRLDHQTATAGVAGVENRLVRRKLAKSNPEIEGETAVGGEGRQARERLARPDHGAAVRHRPVLRLVPYRFQQAPVDLVDAGDGFLGLGDEVTALLFDEVRIADAHGGVEIVEKNLRFRPVDLAVPLDAATDPGRIALLIVLPVGCADGRFAAVIVEPKQILPVTEFPDEVRGAGVLDAPPAGRVGGVSWRSPCAPAVAGIGVAVVAVYGAVGGIERTAAQLHQVCFVGDRTFRGAQSVVALGQELPADLPRILFAQDVAALQKAALRFPHRPRRAPPAHLGEPENRRSVAQGDRLADAPEEHDLAAVVVFTVDTHLSHRDLEALLRPGAAVVVGVLEHVRAQGVDAPVGALVVALNAPQVVLVVGVEHVDPATGRLERHDPGRFRTRRRFDVDQGRPRSSVVRTDGGHNVLTGLAFHSLPSGHRAEPTAVVGNHDVGLIAVAFIGNLGAVGNVAPVAGGFGGLGRGGQRRRGQQLAELAASHRSQSYRNLRPSA